MKESRMRLLRDNGLSLALLGLFFATLVGMALTGHAVSSEDLLRHGRPAEALSEYLFSGEFLSALFENWESEFLQMSAYVVLTAKLFQRGSAESRDPDSPEREGDDLPPHARAWSAVRRWLYARSLGLVLFLFFALSFVAHLLSSSRAANDEAMLHGEAAQSAAAYLADPLFWFESFQNWQSEFLATAVLVVLSIFLRYQGSPESKPVSASDSDTGGG
jgi:hypothetical protein